MTDMALTILPAIENLSERQARWAIYDPPGATTTELSKLGFAAPEVGVGDDLSDIDVLVIGSRALDVTGQLPFSPEDVERGMRVAIFEQTSDALEIFGFRSEDVVPRYVFPRLDEHPVLNELSAEDFVNWRGQGSLVPTTKRNTYPYLDQRVHWGNHGSVASVVIETPHQGAFTPILEAEFDLAYSPLLQWRHGAGEVLFVQLDLTGRLDVEPAAARVARNIVEYLDGPTPSSVPQDKGIYYVGTHSDEVAFLRSLAFEVREVAPSASPPALTVDDFEGSVVVLGRDVASQLSSAVRVRMKGFVRGGGTVLQLPQTAEHFEQTQWPKPVTASAATLARVDAAELESAPELLSGIGPQLLHWRSFLELDVIEPSGLPAGASRLLNGLVAIVPDFKGQWVYSQLDWRQLDTGQNNTRRPRWNVRKFYRQVLTNLGARTSRDGTNGMLG
ncbi:hypothetical protein, partial [Phytoactinopolyspora endophytica]|uniref:hypothetical protein n=1 Tax=Phytoactinopolyspora endophytica TaxID=1642495 RepID=UPI0013EC0C6E